MAKLPSLSGDELVKALTKAGFQVVRQKGSHVSMKRGKSRTVIPLHKELAKGTLFGIMKQCGLTKEDLISIIEKK